MFSVGQKCVCIDQPHPAALAAYPSANYPQKGGIYMIASITEWPGKTLLRFCELDNSHLSGTDNFLPIEPGFNERHFRPLVERKTSIEFAHEILRKVTRKDKVRV